MARRAARTHDPYPCCGKDPDEYGRPKNTICSECAGLIEIGKRAKKADEDGGRREFVWASRPHWWPRYYGDYDMVGRCKFDLDAAMFDLVSALTDWRRRRTQLDTDAATRLPPYLDCKPGHGRYEGQHVVSADGVVRDRVNALDKAIRQALMAAYKAGAERGGNALRRLAAGDLSLTDFDDDLDRAGGGR